MSRPCRESRCANCCLDCRHVSAIFFDVVKKVSVEIKSHPHGRMAHDGLQTLRGPFEMLNKSARRRVAKGVETVARLTDRISLVVLVAGFHDHPTSDLEGFQNRFQTLVRLSTLPLPL